MPTPSWKPAMEPSKVGGALVLRAAGPWRLKVCQRVWV